MKEVNYDFIHFDFYKLLSNIHLSDECLNEFKKFFLENLKILKQKEINYLLIRLAEDARMNEEFINFLLHKLDVYTKFTKKNKHMEEFYYLHHVAIENGNIGLLEFLPLDLIIRTDSDGRNIFHVGILSYGIEFIREVKNISVFEDIKHLFWEEDKFGKTSLDYLKEIVEEEARDLFWI